MNQLHPLIIAGLFHPYYWETNASVGVLFTALGLLKVYGLYGGVVGGRDKPWPQYLVGTCPSWVGRGWRGWGLRIGFPWLLLGIGLWNLGELAWKIHAHAATR